MQCCRASIERLGPLPGVSIAPPLYIIHLGVLGMFSSILHNHLIQHWWQLWSHKEGLHHEGHEGPNQTCRTTCCIGDLLWIKEHLKVAFTQVLSWRCKLLRSVSQIWCTDKASKHLQFSCRETWVTKKQKNKNFNIFKKPLTLCSLCFPFLHHYLLQTLLNHPHNSAGFQHHRHKNVFLKTSKNQNKAGGRLVNSCLNYSATCAALKCYLIWMNLSQSSSHLDCSSCAAVGAVNRLISLNLQPKTQSDMFPTSPVGTRPVILIPYAMRVFVHSCVWSSTSSRRKSGGWGSSSTSGTCASSSWSWRLRTSRTPRVRAHFKTFLTLLSRPHLLTGDLHRCSNLLNPVF